MSARFLILSIKKLLLFVFILSLSACITNGQKFDVSVIDGFQPGVTTLADAEAVLGKPRSISYNPDGSQLVQWMYIQAVYVVASSGHVAILFNRSGKMIRVTHRTES